MNPDMKYEISYTFMKIFNCSLQTKQLPADWKSANITAIYKEGKK